VRSYELRDPDLDRMIKELVAAAGDGTHADIIAEMVTTALKLQRDKASRGDLKLINTALKEMRYSFRTFASHPEPRVTVFGSARVPPTHPNALLAEAFAAEMARRGWGVITGAGPGVMEAGNRGAGLDHSFGVNIRLPFELDANPYIAPERNVNFKYFFTRKLTFVKESLAFALFPGGFGTLDETFELFTLMQTGKSDLHPIVLMEAKGGAYWSHLIQFMEDSLLANDLISESDLDLFTVAGDPVKAAETICGFYSNYHSQRYIDGRLVLRLMQVPTNDEVEALSREFADILVSGSIVPVQASPAELADGDALDLQRLALHFDRRQFGRLRMLIDRLNQLSAPEGGFAMPAPFDEEQAERPW
jgi:hypothetical protein